MGLGQYIYLWNGVEKRKVKSPVKEIGSKLAALCNWARDDGGSSCSKYKLKAQENMISEISFIYLEEPLGVFLIIHWVVEIFRSSTEEIASLSIGQSPAYCPVGCSADEGVQHVLDEDVDSVLGPTTKLLNDIDWSLFATSLTVPASRKANPHCMMKIMTLMMTRKRASSSSASRSSWSASSRVLFPRSSKCFCSTNSKSKSDIILVLLGL